ncbi:MAG: hypothetical protein PHW04_06530 [Candidatus Wallbacteria bacterium]|nr:hypothetical protein [Candidatus Wallbacteria bacterium]
MRFLFVDSITEVSSGRSIRGKKAVSYEECFLSSPYSEEGNFPIVFLLEAMAQLSSWLIQYTHDFKFQPLITGMDLVRFGGDASCGSLLSLEAELINHNEEGGVVSSRVLINDSVVAECSRCLYCNLPLQELNDPDEARQNFRSLCEKAKFL